MKHKLQPATGKPGRGRFILLVCLIARVAVADPPADRWLRDLSEGDLAQRRAAAAALNDAAPDVPGAIEPLIQSLTDRDAQVFSEASSALGKFGASAQPATNRLVEILADRDRQRAFRAADALCRIGPSAVEPLVNVLTAGDERAGAAALDALAGMGPDAAPATAAIGNLLGHKSRDIDDRAVTALAAIGRSVEPLLVELLKSPQMSVRRSALKVVGQLTPRPVNFREDVLRLVNDDNAEVRALAIESLVLIAPEAPASARQVLSGLQDEVGHVRDTAILMVRYLSPERQLELLPTLVDWLSDLDQPVLSEAAAAGLARMPRHGSAVAEPLVERWLQDPTLESPYAFAVQSLGPTTLDSLLAMAQVGSPSDQQATIALIAGMGHTVSAALIERLQDEDAIKRRLVVECLGQIQPANPATVAATQAFLTDDQPQAIREAAVISLGNMGHLAQSAVPALRALRDRVDSREQQLIDEQLARIEQR